MSEEPKVIVKNLWWLGLSDADKQLLLARYKPDTIYLAKKTHHPDGTIDLVWGGELRDETDIIGQA